jgi:hypothetical protein
VAISSKILLLASGFLFGLLLPEAVIQAAPKGAGVTKGQKVKRPNNRKARKTIYKPRSEFTWAGRGGPFVWLPYRMGKLSVATISGKYSDTQTDPSATSAEAQAISSTQADVEIAGTRITYDLGLMFELEFHFESRSETPVSDTWAGRTTTVSTIGYTIPFFRQITPLIGIHQEKNTHNLTKRVSQTVAVHDYTAFIVGASFVQKVFSTKRFAMLLNGRVHMFNMALGTDPGSEIEVSVGAAHTLMGVRYDVDAGMINQTVDSTGINAAGSALKVTSATASSFFRAGVWF